MTDGLSLVPAGTYCLMAWAGPHLTDSPMSAPCSCKLPERHEGRHLCLTMGCRSWKNQQPDDPTWASEQVHDGECDCVNCELSRSEVADEGA